jgi:phosphatidylethanolamine-binding protein (PEBP) family uncharacterized protein
MKLWSDSWTNGDRIPARYGAGKPDGAGGATFSDNLNPHLAWSDLPAGTRSLVLICHDFDVPSKGDDVNQPGREVPADLARVDFFHWVLVDLPPTPSSIGEGDYSRGFTARGKAGPAVALPQAAGARHGLNDYTGWFAGHEQMAGQYFGTTTCSRSTPWPCRGCRWKACSPARRCASSWPGACWAKPPSRVPTR